jgi:hypothetical protein
MGLEYEGASPVNEIRLNLVAITIFSLVMMSVFAPLVNIPPTIPAIAVAGILGLATVDTLAWKGQGSTLLLDAIARFSSDYRRRIVHHEAGHFLVAHLVGIPITGYTLNAWEAFRQGQPGFGGISFDSEELNAQLDQGTLTTDLIDRYCRVWMAGIAAETLVYGDVEGGNDDRQKLRILWTQLQRPLSECEQKERWSALQAKTLLQANWPAYEALVNALDNRQSVDECLQAMQAAMATA